jgi:hypothetical protein
MPSLFTSSPSSCIKTFTASSARSTVAGIRKKHADSQYHVHSTIRAMEWSAMHRTCPSGLFGIDKVGWAHAKIAIACTKPYADGTTKEPCIQVSRHHADLDQKTFSGFPGPDPILASLDRSWTGSIKRIWPKPRTTLDSSSLHVRKRPC